MGNTVSIELALALKLTFKMPLENKKRKWKQSP